jgi:outer membrane receptor for ferrienterochelin and colicin
MKKIRLLWILLLISAATSAQHSFKVQIKCAHHKEPLAGATISIGKLNKSAIADSNGIVVINDIPTGTYLVRFSFVGRPDLEKEYSFPIANNETQVVMLEEAEEHEEEEVVIVSTRSSRTIQDIPTRVEFIAGEELDEKANMKPGDIRMVLNESTGIQTQQTSATSANASIRIQGLDGRYTQILKDGFPIYSGFSSGLGLLQTPPLDLKQFEVIKGSASTLYGGGAIAGLVNLISKTPHDERELKFHVDVTTAGGLNTSGFYGQKFGKTGVTLFASRNSNSAYDPADIGLSAIPKFERYTVNPKFFAYFNPKTTLSIGVNLTTEERTGGDMEFIKGDNPTGYFEKNNTDRFSTQLSFEHHVGKSSLITFKNSYNHFKRVISSVGYGFNGKQNGTFSEFTYSYHGDNTEWVTGLNLLTDDFVEKPMSAAPSRNYDQLTVGAFAQNTWKVNEKVHIESGIRGDHVKDYGFAFLPRISTLFKFTSQLSSRIGGGLGYKTPTIFTEESERLQYKNVLPIDEAVNKLERSYGLSGDINYKTRFADGKGSFSINQLFFYTRIDDPLLLQPDGPNYRFNTISDGHIDSKGIETNVKVGYSDFKLFLGYTFTSAYLHQGSEKEENFLTPKHRLNSVLLYEVEEKWKAGLEAYYFSEQELSDGITGRSYWITGFMVEKLWEKFSLYINFENFLDARQTRYGSIYTGPISNPVFKDIYAPLDGFVVNGGVKLRL